jgi:hypothetical protein
MSDFSFLAQGVRSPDIAEAQKQALTIAQLANANESSGLDLQSKRQMIELMKDPAFAQVMGATMGGDQGQGDQWAGLLSKYPAAAGPAMTQQMGMVKNIADIGKLRADTDKASTEAKVQRLQVLSNAADGFANQKEPLDPSKVLTFVRQGAYIGAGPLMADVVAAAQAGDEPGLRKAFANFSQAGATMAQRASANKENVGAELAPQQFNLDRYKAMAEQAEKLGGEVRQDVSGNLVIVRKLAGVQQPTPPGEAGAGGAPVMSFPPGTPAQPVNSIKAAKAGDAAGRPVSFDPQPQATSAPPQAAAQPQPASTLPMVSQVGVQAALSPVEAAQSATRTKTLEESRSSANIAQRALQVIPALRAEIAQGYTGPLAGSDAGKQLLNLAVSIGVLPPDQVDRVGKMRASDSLVTELLGPMARQMNPRGSNASLKIVQDAKPGTANSLPIALEMMNALSTDSRNTIAYDKALNEHVTRNPQDYGLSQWKPPAPSMVPRGNKSFNELPPASVANIGKATDPDTGVTYINRNGSKWELVK